MAYGECNLCKEIVNENYVKEGVYFVNDNTYIKLSICDNCLNESYILPIDEEQAENSNYDVDMMEIYKEYDYIFKDITTKFKRQLYNVLIDNMKKNINDFKLLLDLEDITFKSDKSNELFITLIGDKKHE